MRQRTVPRACRSATDLGFQLGLPIVNALIDSSGQTVAAQPLLTCPARFSASGSTPRPRSRGGVRPTTDFYFDNAPAFTLLPGAEARGLRRIAWIDDPAPLRSGWAWGSKISERGNRGSSSASGKGECWCWTGPIPISDHNRHGTIKALLFNGLLYRTELGE